jgi:mono/diheme cytochrome c family protein
MTKSMTNTAARYWRTNKALLALAALYSVALLGCHPDMWNQPRYTALQKNTFFADNAADRLPVENTIRYDGSRRPWVNPMYAELTGDAVVPSYLDDVFTTGREGEGFKADNYFDVTQALLERGQERYNAICAHCHGAGGYGNGLVTQRGFPMPPSYHIDRLREVEDGYIVDVIRNGFGRMYSHAARVAPEDRWAIAAYIRALQYSQNVPDADLSDEDRKELDKALNPEPETADHNTADSHAH